MNPTYRFRLNSFSKGPGIDILGKFTRRISGGGSDFSGGNANIQEIYGNTLVWNQLCANPVQSITGFNSSYVYSQFGTFDIIAGHKYLLLFDIDAPTFAVTGVYSEAETKGQTLWFNTPGIFTADDNMTAAAPWITIADYNSHDATFNVFDLTRMFGAGHEPSTVAEFEALFPLPYYAYNAGGIINNKVTAIQTVGFNQWDEEWVNGYVDITTGNVIEGSSTTIASKNLIPVIGNKTYYFKGKGYITMYDANQAVVGQVYKNNDNFDISSDANYIRFHIDGYGTTYNHDICINLSDPAKNGEYEAYWQNVRSLPVTTAKSNGAAVFPNGMNGRGSVCDILMATKAVKKWDSRAYQAGDESDPDVITDGTTTIYRLATPVEYTLDWPLAISYRVDNFGTEEFKPINGKNPTTAPGIILVKYPTTEVEERQVFPIYKNGLSKNFEKESGQEFFREKLSGELTFVAEDYAFIIGAAFETKFSLKIQISYDAGITWLPYWEGYFFKVDCTINEADKFIKVNPNTIDSYDAILSGLDKEFNLIELAPVIEPILADKRPIIQVYVPGEKTIACFLGNMWWEQECESIAGEQLILNYHFNLIDSFRAFECTGAVVANLLVGGNNPDYEISYVTGISTYITITRVSDGAEWEKSFIGQVPSFPTTLTPVTGTPASGDVIVDSQAISLYGRMLTNLDNVPGIGNTTSIPDNDIVADNRNYTRCVGYNKSGFLVGNDVFSSTPTEWGLYQPGKYYIEPPAGSYGDVYYPVSRNQWDWYSIWLPVGSLAEIESGRSQFTLRDAYPIYSVISVLLNEIAPGISHDGNTDYSVFLYGTNPITQYNHRLFITPKSNVINSNYDQPAQKAPITLRKVLNMLRDCFRCYWYIDEQKRLRIEHILFFRKGGSYYVEPIVGINLTTMINTKNGKSLATGQDSYGFDKEEIAERYEFGWMDDVSQPFEGYPFLMLSNYVEPGKVQKINIEDFTSDIDYILLNPSNISPDGFVLLAAVEQGGNYVLPYYYSYYKGENILQNGYVAFCALYEYYLYDLPSSTYSYGGNIGQSRGTKRIKRQEKVVLPCLYDPDLLKLVKTNIGDGNIRRLSLDLQSRTASATLEYDTE